MIKVLDLGSNSGPHYIALTKDEKRLVITDYFLNEDGVGKVHAEGDHKIHVAKVQEKNLVLDSNFDVDFNRVFKESCEAPWRRYEIRRYLQRASFRGLAPAGLSPPGHQGTKIHQKIFSKISVPCALVTLW